MKRWIAAVLVLAVVALFVRLGVWQLHRAEEKRALVEAHAARLVLAPLTRLPPAAELEEMRYRRIRLAGHYDVAHQVLLDNQVYNGRAGYQALTPLRDAGGDCAVLVNRGWVAAPPERSQLPDVSLARVDGQVEGLIDRYPAVGLRLKGAEELAGSYPVVAQTLDAEQLSTRLGYCVLPYQILLAPDAADGYVREWRMQHIDPDKSLGYAFQWFALAVGLAAYGGWAAWRHRPSLSNQSQRSARNDEQT